MKRTDPISHYAETLLHKLEVKTARIGVIGLGYVGLPLAVEKAKSGYEVVGFDVQQSRVDKVNQGINYIGDIAEEDLRNAVESEKLKATSDYSLIETLDAVTICVPTPLDSHHQPDTSYVEASARSVLEFLQPGMLVILESTTYPGTTEEIMQPILESRGLRCGVDFFLAYSPERVDPGNKSFNTRNTPKVVGGVTSLCTKLAAALYRKVLAGRIHEVSSPKVAELEKILENTFRSINIALANEMAMLCEKMQIDVWEVIQAAATKPYGFMPFLPGPGVGGHCIPIDPYYLDWKAREYEFHTKLIETAGSINRSMPDYMIERITKILNQERKVLNGAKILLLGVTYKQDIDDVRESPSLQILQRLNKLGAEVYPVDLYVDRFDFQGEEKLTVPLTTGLVEECDLVLIATAHTDFDYEMIANHARLIFDMRNAMSHIPVSGNYFKL